MYLQAWSGGSCLDWLESPRRWLWQLDYRSMGVSKGEFSTYGRVLSQRRLHWPGHLLWGETLDDSQRTSWQAAVRYEFTLFEQGSITYLFLSRSSAGVILDMVLSLKFVEFKVLRLSCCRLWSCWLQLIWREYFELEEAVFMYLNPKIFICLAIRPELQQHLISDAFLKH
jgi:hypothetical protein